MLILVIYTFPFTNTVELTDFINAIDIIIINLTASVIVL